MRLKEFKANLQPNIPKHNLSGHKNIINRLLVGNYISKVKRTGLEFLDYRPYTAGDDANKIDWKASKKSQKLLVKETIEEKAVNVLFLVDVSDSMLCSSIPKLKCEYAAELICALSFVIQREGNAIGLVMFSDKIVKTLPPLIGTTQYYNMMKELQKTRNYGGDCNIKKALKQSMGLLRVPSLVIIISDFINPSKGWEDYIKIISMQYHILGIMIRDQRDKVLPQDKGFFVVEHPTTNEKLVIDTKEYYKKYKAFVEEEEEQINTSFKKAKSAVLLLDSNKHFFNPLVNFLERQSRVVHK
ncbi:DUF58 domain-containing protein [Candidatus Woesearchaeota archaeon]|nr:DUF58 domain-containing protein [Candidatus Woesearchaeota archaeon]